jgi:leucyl aminopeptidase
MHARAMAAAVMMIVGSTAGAAQSSWLTVGEHAYTQLRKSSYKLTLRATQPVPAAQAGMAENVYLLRVAARDVPAIAATLHRKLRHCGGFMFHASEADARQALAAPPQPPFALTRPAYTITNQAVVAPLLAQMDGQQIGATIAALSGFVNRYYSSEHGASAADWLSSHWSALAARHSGITVTRFAHAGYGQRSVMATIAGSDQAAQVVVLGAHLDSINLGSTGRNAVAPGADDDASGVAGLSEVMRVLALANLRPRRSITLIAYAAEEVGLRGSQDIARDFMQRQVDVVGVLQLDMTSFKGSAKDIYLISDYTDGQQNAFLGRLAAAYLPELTVGSDRCGYACSDHAAWHAHGVASSMPFESLLAQDNPRIHTQDDRADKAGKGSVHALKFARLAAAYALELGMETK